MNSSEQINELISALAKAQAKITPPQKSHEAKVQSKSGASYSYRYTDLAEVVDVSRIPLSENGLSIIQLSHDTESQECLVETVLAHSSGQWISGIMRMKPLDSGPQPYGSCLTYCRRYSALMILGLAPEDDDGKAATDRKAETKTAAKTEAKIDSKSILLEIKSEAERAGIDPRQEYDRRFPDKPTLEQLQKWLNELKETGSQPPEGPQDESHEITDWSEFWGRAAAIARDKTKEQIAGILGVKRMEDWTETLDEALEQLRKLCGKKA